VWRKPGEELSGGKKNLDPMVKHGGGRMLVWGCVAASGVGKFDSIAGNMNKRVHVNILREHPKASA
jgi:hypothetical protein